MIDKFPDKNKHIKTEPQKARERLVKEIEVLELLRSNPNFSIQQYQNLLNKKRLLLFTDPVTGLLNESGARERTDSLIKDAKPLLLVRLNISGFKKVNSTYSHSGGDRVLSQLGELLSNSFRKEDDVVTSRVHGDEFVIILQTATGSPSIESIQNRIEGIFNSNSEKGSRLDDSYLRLGLSHDILLAESNKNTNNYEDLYNAAKSLDEENVGVGSAKRLIHDELSLSYETELSELVEKRKSRIHELEDILSDLSNSEQQDYLAEDGIKTIYIELLALYDEALDTDVLTGISNKHFVEAKINKMIEQRKESDSYLGYGYVGMCDLRGFGDINDINGRDKGDIVLKEFSQIFLKKAKDLEEYLGPPSEVSVARSGGDEFHIIVSGPKTLDDFNIEKLINKFIIIPSISEIVDFCKNNNIKYSRPGVHFGGKSIENESTSDEVLRNTEVVKNRTKTEKMVGMMGLLGPKTIPMLNRIF